MGIVGTAAMIAYASWKETQIKVVDGKEILNNYDEVREKYTSYFKNPKTGEALEVPRTDLISTVCSSFAEELTEQLKNGGVSELQAKNAAQFLIDTPVENSYATLLPLKKVREFGTDNNMKLFVLENKELVDRIKEAKKAKEAYIAAKESQENKKKKNKEEVPL
jgi:hypothetical protein